MKELLTLEEKSNAQKKSYAILTLNRPESMNAINRPLLEELSSAIKHLNNNSAASVVIIQGSARAFCAGADVASMKNMDKKELLSFLNYGQQVLQQLYEAKFISIAAIHGCALGGGLELALACTLRLATAEAKLGLPEVNLGIFPTFGGTQRLSRLIGLGPASELIISGRIIAAKRAEELKLINICCTAQAKLESLSKKEKAEQEQKHCLQEAEQYLQSLLSNCSQNAQRYAWQAIRQGLEKQSMQEALELELDYFHSYIDDPNSDHKEGLTAFTEKRKANFDNLPSSTT